MEELQPGTQTSVLGFSGRTFSSEVRRGVEGKRRVQESLVVFDRREREREQGSFSK